MSIKIVTDSTSYLPLDQRKKLDIQVVSLSISFADASYLEDEIENSVFYDKMALAKAIPTSSQPSVQKFCEVFENILSQGHEVLGIFLSSDMSGTYSTALMAKNIMLEKYPNRKIEIVDSRSNCMQTGFLVLAAQEAIEKDLAINEVLHILEKVKNRTRFLFTPHTLEYLRKGGRIGGAEALLGTILQIRPILTVIDGKTSVFDKVRTKSRAIDRILEALVSDTGAKGLERVAVHHINNPREGNSIAQQITKQLQIDVPVYSIGPVIGLHVGPGTVGVVYQTKEEL